ncbi:hypothetical protein [Dolosigranulum pigrum]|uniref:hypothetical protein n=1 Tax=Dolosigranulum pigrum TaxID=29394 RepID=UPI001AD890CA|nr:hypothetical protein [Dolosigranulum pigrum]QTJ33938.1 hypothetical protein FE322_00740 [Dolosigranulum pigrum]QTJ47603.1 hypothetical protein FE330_00710 [Dolosigranulum pigrum]
MNKKTKEVNKKEKKSTELSSENMELKNKNDTLTQRLNQLNWYVEEQEGKKKTHSRGMVQLIQLVWGLRGEMNPLK